MLLKCISTGTNISSLLSPLLQTNHSQLLLQGCDRLYLNSTTTCHTLLPSQGAGGGATSHLSSPLWKILLLPPSYLVLNWPLRVGLYTFLNDIIFPKSLQESGFGNYLSFIVQYAAVDEAGCNLAVAGRAGFALYSGINRKWKLFGNEIQVRVKHTRLPLHHLVMVAKQHRSIQTKIVTHTHTPCRSRR